MQSRTNLAVDPRRGALMALGALALAVGVVLALAAPASATHTLYRFTGSRDADVFLIEKDASGNLRLCATTCTTRTPSAIDAIVVDGFEGDDILLVGHGSDLFTDAENALPVTFSGGPGMDEIRICGDSPAGYAHSLGSCTQDLQTTVTPGASANETRVEQARGTRFVSLTLQDVGVIRDESPGALAISATAAADNVVLDEVGGLGIVTVNSQTPYGYGSKTQLVVDAGGASDVVRVAGVGALGSASCAAGAATSLCVIADGAPDDTLIVTGAAGLAETVRLATTAAGQSSLSGLSGIGTIDLTGIDAVDVTLQQGGGDTFQVDGSFGDDVLRIAPSAAAGPLGLSGDLDRAGTPFPLPAVSLHGDGSGTALRLAFVAGAGTDDVDHLGTTRDDRFGLREPGGSPCTDLGPDRLTHAVDGLARHILDSTGVERYALDGRDGDDSLDTCGLLAATTTFRGGNGNDTVRSTSSRSTTSIDIDYDTIQASGGVLTATATETFDVDGGNRVVTVRSSGTDDDLTVTPTAAADATVVRAGDPTTVRLRGMAALTVDPGAGDDTITVLATTGADEIAVNRGFSPTDPLAIAVGTWAPVRTAAATTEAVVAKGRSGNDRFLIAGEHGPAALTLDGGSDTDGDTILVGYPVTDAGVTLDAAFGSGQAFVNGPPIAFTTLETVDVEGDDSGTMTVSGSDGPDALDQNGDTVRGPATLVRWSAFPAVVVDARAGDDTVSLNPTTGTSSSLTAVMGAGLADTLDISGSSLSETITYVPSSDDSGALTFGARTADFTGTETVLLDGGTTLPGADVLVVDTPTIDGTLIHEPGRSFDSGTLWFRDASGASTSAPTLAYGGLGDGRVELPGASQADNLVYRGDAAANAFFVTNGPGAEAAEIVLDAQIPLRTTGIHTLELDGAGGSDTFQVPSTHRFGGTDPGPGIILQGGGTGGDTATVIGDGQHIKVDLDVEEIAEGDLRPIAHVGIDWLVMQAGGAPVTVFGGPAPDAVVYTPTGANAGTMTLGGAVVELRDIGPALSVDTREGADTVRVVGTSLDDNVDVARGVITTVSVGALQPLEVPPTLEALTVDAADGSDTFTVSGAGGPATLNVAGADPTVAGDTVVLVDAMASVTYSAVPGSGQLGSAGGPVQFSGIESVFVQGDGTGELTLYGTGGPDTVTIGTEEEPTIQINAGAAVNHSGYPVITVDTGGGQDAATLSYRSLGDAELVRIVGGAATTDAATLVDTEGTTRQFTWTPTATDGGTMTASAHPTTVEIASTESLTLDGRGNDDAIVVVTPGGVQDVAVAAAADPSGGSIAVANLLPMTFGNVGAGSLTVADVGGVREDRITLSGRPTSDTFTVEGAIDEVRLGSWVRFTPSSAATLVLNGLDGDDQFTVSGPLPYTSLVTDGMAPDLGDSLSLDGPVGAVTVNLAAASVTGYGGTVTFPGVASLLTDVAFEDLTQEGTERDDALCYDPQSPRDGRLYIVGAPAGGSLETICLPDQRGLNVLHSFVDVGTLYVDGGPGMDEVIVNGTVQRDLITIHALAPIAEVTVHPSPEDGGTFRLPLHVHVATTESVVVAADGGSDTIDVTMYDNETTRFTVYGEIPEAKHGSDELYVRDGTGRAHWSNTTGHEKGTGTVTATYPKGAGNTVRVDYDGIEYYKVFRDPKN